MSISIRKVGIIGAGQMGNGIAQVCAQAGYDVVLHDISEERIQAGLATINGNLAKLVQKGSLDETMRREVLDKIASGPTLDDLHSCDLVIEAATENEEVKRRIKDPIVIEHM